MAISCRQQHQNVLRYLRKEPRFSARLSPYMEFLDRFSSNFVYNRPVGAADTRADTHDGGNRRFFANTRTRLTEVN